MALSPEDVQAILKILDDTPGDELTLETEKYTLLLKRSKDGSGWQQSIQTSQSSESQKETVVVADTEEPEPTEPGLTDIRSPMVGTFYRAPKPGAAPFVEKGSQVGNDTVIAIIEVMKLMSSIPAGAEGEVVEVLVDDATFVEKGQLLMRVRP